jgi:hypothetical protein
MPIVVEDGITLTLHNGDTVTLYERNISVAERKAINKRMMVFLSSLEYKKKLGEKIDEKRKAIEENDSLNGDREKLLEDVAIEGADLISSVDQVEIHAEVLSRRFQSWDVYATQKDMDEGKYVELSMGALMTFCEKPKRAALVGEIVEKLLEHDKREEKNVLSGVVDGGSISIATPPLA